MVRILLLLVIGFVIYALFRGFFKSQLKDKDDSPSAPQAGKGSPQGGKADDLVACAICGVNMPRGDSKEEGGRVTCRDPKSCKHAG